MQLRMVLNFGSDIILGCAWILTWIVPPMHIPCITHLVVLPSRLLGAHVPCEVVVPATRQTGAAAGEAPLGGVHQITWVIRFSKNSSSSSSKSCSSFSNITSQKMVLVVTDLRACTLWCTYVHINQSWQLQPPYLYDIYINMHMIN